MKYLYKYPQSEFPYEKLKQENKNRDKTQPEYELMDTGVFDEDKYFDVFIEYAKADFDDICIKITAINRSENAAPLHILPTVWFRNTWSWFDNAKKPEMRETDIDLENLSAIQISEEKRGNYRLLCEGSSQLLFTENETNYEKLYGSKNNSPYTKDGIGEFVIRNDHKAVNPKQIGTKASAHYALNIPANGERNCLFALKREGICRKTNVCNA